MSMTIGVLHRVEELADRESGEGQPGRVPYKNLIPLNEVIAEALGRTPECQGVWDLYFRFIREFGARLVGLAILKDNHRTYGMLAADIGNIITFNSLRQFC